VLSVGQALLILPYELNFPVFWCLVGLRHVDVCVSSKSHIWKQENTWFGLHYYLSICVLFKDTVSGSDRMASSGRMNNKWWIGRNVDGSSRGLFQVIQAFACADWETSRMTSFEANGADSWFYLTILFSFMGYVTPNGRMVVNGVAGGKRRRQSQPASTLPWRFRFKEPSYVTIFPLQRVLHCSNTADTSF
jgi:hypothetical protein